jgi:hypothetical protein
MISTPDGTRLVRGDLTGPLEEAEALGNELADRLWPQAKDILQGESFGKGKEEG